MLYHSKNSELFYQRLLLPLMAVVFALIIPDSVFSRDHKTLPIGSPAPDFNLLSTDGNMVSLSSFEQSKILVVVFTCNHCPTAQAYEDRIIKLTSQYKSSGVAVVAIMPNDPKSLRLDELDFSDLGDSYEEMKIRASEKKFNFPYLYDGDSQKVSEAYGPVATPHVFIFDEKRILRYAGRFDNMESPFKTPGSNDARDAVEALLNNKEIANSSTKVFGCSIKWSEKRETVAKAFEKWSKEPVSVEPIKTEAFRKLINDSSGKLKLIYVWDLSCGICEKSFPEFITINRMYRDRDFEFISINLDNSTSSDEVIRYLTKNQASNKNYQLEDPNAKMVKDFIPGWNRKIPLTLLVEPGGRIAYKMQGAIDPAVIKKTIVENHMIGRYP